MLLFYLSLIALLFWVIILIVPWQPWRTKEQWDVTTRQADSDLRNVTVLIPARNEKEVIEQTISSVLKQGGGIRIIVVDDNSEDCTAQIIQNLQGDGVTVINGKSRPPEWSGKLWALEQGRRQIETPITVLLDADIMLKPGVIAGLQKRLQTEEFSFLSLMAAPALSGFWERLLMPAFIYFFKFLYPFKLANSDKEAVAAAAGGCVMMKTDVLKSIGGFQSIRDALIDDCMLARKVKDEGYRTWLGLTHSAKSIRPYNGLAEIWNMVARTAYTQLQYSPLLLLLCTAIMIVVYAVPVAALFMFSGIDLVIPAITTLIMIVTFLPVLRYYRLNAFKSLALPFIGLMFLAMTWTSAVRYWRGERLRWRGRVVKSERWQP